MEEHRKDVAVATLVVALGYFVVRAIKSKRNQTVSRKQWLTPCRGNTIQLSANFV